MSDQIGRGTATYLYRLYDSSDELLYVGVTTNVERRMSEHRPKPWYARVARFQVDEYPTRWRAVLAECVAGHGQHGILPGGIGKAMAASMAREELTEAAAHPAYAHLTDGLLARQWGIPVQHVRELRQPSAWTPGDRQTTSDPLSLTQG
jgi:hypothetical protein